MSIGADFCKASNLCHENATCLNLRTKYVCQCKEGFIGDGTTCAGEMTVTHDRPESSHGDVGIKVILVKPKTGASGPVVLNTATARL